MTIKISGLDALQKQLKEAQQALASLDGTITTLKFDPLDPASVQSAIRQMEQAIDAKLSRYRQNPIISPLIAETKKRYRDQILELSRKN